MAVKTRQRLFQARHRRGRHARSCRPRASCRRPPASWCSPTRPWSGPMRSPMLQGIHQDGVLKARDTYEIMRAEDVGWAANKIVLGKLSGRNAFKQRLKELGIEMESEADINAGFVRFKELADRKSDIFDEDIIALVMDEAVAAEHEHYQLLARCRSARKWAREAACQRRRSSRRRCRELQRRECRQWPGRRQPEGDRIEASQSGAEMLLYSVNAITSGSTESQGEVTVRLQHGGPGRQRCRLRPRHRRRVGKGLPFGAEQAAQQGGAGWRRKG